MSADPNVARLLAGWRMKIAAGDLSLAKNIERKLNSQYGIDPYATDVDGVDAVPPLEAAVPPKMETAVPERPRPPRQSWVKKAEASNE